MRRLLSTVALGLAFSLVASAEDALQYIFAGASLVGVGTAALRDPRAPERIVRDLDSWCRANEVDNLDGLIGSLKLG